jgi:thiamine biosynthesis lipoprotein
MRRYIKLLPLVMLLFLTSCTLNQDSKIQGFSMDAPYRISSKSATKIQMQVAEKYLNNCDTMFSAYNENSMLYKLNTAKEQVLFSPSTDGSYQEALAYNKDLYTIIDIGKKYSNDVFDISIRPITKLWNFKDGTTIPDSNLIKENLKKVDYHNILIETINGSGSIKLLNNSEIELGAIAKGFVAEKIGTMLDDAIIDIGGTVKSTYKQNITVGLKSPDGDGFFASLELMPNKAVSTSGSYERNFTVDGKLYHHILNSKTGYPIDNDLVSISVIHSSGTIADILSTTFFAQGMEQTLANLQDAECVFVTKDNSVYLTKGIINFKILNEKYKLK